MRIIKHTHANTTATRRTKNRRMLKSEKWTADEEINSGDFFLWLQYGLLPKYMNLGGKVLNK